jgi:hypothetical protein
MSRYVVHEGFGTNESGERMYFGADALAARHGVSEFVRASEEITRQADDVHLYPPVNGVLEVRIGGLYYDGDGQEPEPEEDWEPEPESPRYILHPGDVISNYDGSLQYISCSNLLYLYGVPKAAGAEAIVCFSKLGTAPRGYVPRPDDIHLHPRADGNYTLPGAGKVLKHVEKAPPMIDFSKRRIRVSRKK